MAWAWNAKSPPAEVGGRQSTGASLLALALRQLRPQRLADGASLLCLGAVPLSLLAVGLLLNGLSPPQDFAPAQEGLEPRQAVRLA
jgi:hypothetical protein